MTKNFDHAKARKAKNRRAKNAHNQFVNGRKRLGKKYAEGVA
jgi:hypothetical protein